MKATSYNCSQNLFRTGLRCSLKSSSVKAPKALEREILKRYLKPLKENRKQGVTYKYLVLIPAQLLPLQSTIPGPEPRDYRGMLNFFQTMWISVRTSG